KRVPLAIVLSLGIWTPSEQVNAQAQPGDPPVVQELPRPQPIPEFSLPNLTTVPIPRQASGPNWTQADTAVHPKDAQGIWILEFSFKPVRLIEIDIPGKGRRKVHYLYYKVVNRTGEPRLFVPQFTLVTDSGQRSEDVPLPLAVKRIQVKEDPSIPLLGAVQTTGTIPPSTKDGVDDAVYGVAIWDDVDFKADAFSIFVRGLSNGYQEVSPPDGGDPFTRYKALRIDFDRPGDERNPSSREIFLREPPFEWVYYP
ncbi:MAG TPA: hypothetical protein VFT74_00730, partial [Isosphaeraceae bacterium]|nr:hypothetical protein [Isosphaeraceae bacterium]